MRQAVGYFTVPSINLVDFQDVIIIILQGEAGSIRVGLRIRDGDMW